MESQNANALTGEFHMRKFISFAITMLVTLVLWNLPSTCFGIDGLTVTQQRVIAIFVMAVLLWLTECIASWATSIVIIMVMLFSVSDSSLFFLKGEGMDPAAFGELIPYKSIMATFADPTVILFLGGFVLAIAATKSGLDAWIAKETLMLFGKKSENVLLGFILITGFFSMFISNTATAAMMLTFLTPVFKSLPANGKGRIALTMAIPIGANLGGMGTPIGTPPNSFAFKVINQPLAEGGMGLDMSFGEWMMYMVPLVIVLLLLSWFVILKLFPFTAKTIELKFDGHVAHNWRSAVVAITFVVTIALWIFGKQLGVNSFIPAILPIGVFAITGVLTSKDLKNIDWSVLWMVAGGFALGLGMDKTGLAAAAINSIPFGSFSPVIIIIVSGLVCYALSNFISNTATAALLVPILAVVCTGMGDKLAIVGGAPTVLIGVACAASCAMSLPISTPPNAIAYSTGLIEQKDMMKAGLIAGIASMIISYAMLITLGKLGML